MGWSCRKMGDEDWQSRCPENGGEVEARKIKIVMGDCIKRHRKSGRRMKM